MRIKTQQLTKKLEEIVARNNIKSSYVQDYSYFHVTYPRKQRPGTAYRSNRTVTTIGFDRRNFQGKKYHQYYQGYKKFSTIPNSKIKDKIC